MQLVGIIKRRNDMNILIKRIARKRNYTVGKLYIDGQYFCDTLEDIDRGLILDMSIEHINNIKIPNVTAIPMGTYPVTIDVISQKYSKKDFYIKNANGGRVPRVLNVPGFSGILIHVGNTDKDTSGCILVGLNKVVGKLINSQITFINLYKKLLEARTPITLIIK